MEKLSGFYGNMLWKEGNNGEGQERLLIGNDPEAELQHGEN